MSALEEWYDEAMLVRRTKGTRGRIGGEEVTKIGRLEIMESFEGDGSNFVCNALRDRKPVQRMENKRNIMGAADRRDNDSSQCILDQLETIERKVREVVEKGVTVIEFGRDERIGKDNGRVSVEGGTNLTKLTNVVKGRRTDRRAVFFERESVVEDNSEVATRWNVGERSTLERDDR